MRGKKLALTTGIAVVALVLAVAGGRSGAVTRVGGGPLSIRPQMARSQTQPRPTSSCAALLGIRCYAPAQFEKAYDLAGLHAAGIDGSGQTIAIVDSFGSPTIANDLHQFDQTFGVSNPYGVPIDPAIAQDPSLTIISPAGAPPPFDPSNGDMVGWAQETTLDVEWAHVIAPKAHILLVETPVSETEGVQGFPEIVTAENYVIDHHLASVITQSFGATEETFPNQQALLNLRSAFLNAQHNNVTVLGSSGDEGSTDFELNGQDLYPMQVNSWPSSDPLVTSIGGTQMNLDDSGTRLSPDVVWNDTDVGIQAAGGGGVSAVFGRPDFQNGVASAVGAARGTPDISMNAAVDGGVWVYYTFVGAASPWHIFGGTSAASPEFSGIVAMADQLAGHSLGDINNALYSLQYGGGLVDVTTGNNGIGPFQNSDNNIYNVPGFNAAPGYDLASGLGTIDGGLFVPALATAHGTPTLTTVASPGVTLGGSISDTATLSNGFSPGGSITFRLYAPSDTTCSGGAVTSSTVTVAGNGSYTSASFTPSLLPGTYRWVASYSGDASNSAFAAPCGAANESVTVTTSKASPTVTTQASPHVEIGGSVHDTATLAGGSSPTGSITFKLYNVNDPTCAGAPVQTMTVAVTGNGSYPSPSFNPTNSGTYHWVASYSGDASNNAFTDPCGAANESVSVGPILLGGPGGS